MNVKEEGQRSAVAIPKGHGRPFHAAAPRVVRRLWRRRWFDLLTRSSLPLFASVLATAIAARFLAGASIGVPAALGISALWLAALAAWSWLRRPAPAAALAFWDQRVGRE